MDRKEALEQIRKSCQMIATELMRLHPATAALNEKAIQDEVYRALFELTKQLEIIKKMSRKAELKAAGEADDLPPVL